MKLNQEILDEWFVSAEEAEAVTVKELLIEKRIQYLKGWLDGYKSHSKVKRDKSEGELLVLDAVLAQVPKRRWIIAAPDENCLAEI